MNKIVFSFFMLIIFTNCTHRIVRIGYNKQDKRTGHCEIIFKTNQVIADSVATKVGEIRLGDTGFSVACSEEHAIEILRNEACGLNADLVNITEERRPDLLSSCYRCKAEFYSFKDKSKKESGSANYSSQEVHERVSSDRKNNTVIVVMSLIVGLVASFWLMGK